MATEQEHQVRDVRYRVSGTWGLLGVEGVGSGEGSFTAPRLGAMAVPPRGALSGIRLCVVLSLKSLLGALATCPLSNKHGS